MSLIQQHYPLKAHNTLGLEQTARAFATIDDLQQLDQPLEWAERQQLPVQILSQGSNVILSQDLEALVLQPRFDEFVVVAEDADAVHLRVGAGLDWDQTIARCLANGWYGLENLSLIPGSVGAAPVQNIGAYGVEAGDRIQAVLAYDLTSRQTIRLEHEACEFAYRHSVFKSPQGRALLIYAVEFKLHKRFYPQTHYPALNNALGEHPNLSAADVRHCVCHIRRQKLPDPRQLPNAGSFFKNPLIDASHYQRLAAQNPALPAYPQDNGQVKLAAAWLIEQGGWRGRRQGDVGMHQAQALVMVNYAQAKGRDILELAAAIQADVKQRYQIGLEIEPVIL